MSTLSVRRPLSVVAVLAMVATMLFAVAGTAATATSPPSDACPATIPSAGFTDIGALTQETQDAIDCIAFYDITEGTSENIYGPYDDVNRWQMALFLTRKLTTAGVELPSGAPQGFTDIGDLPAETQTAINQMAQLEITEGTTPTTYEPMGDVNRWQMALFLARDLDVMGVVPVAIARVVVTPATSVTLADGGARAYTATFSNTDGTPYSGFVGIELLDATAAGAPIYNTDPLYVAFESVDGAGFGNTTTREFNGFAGADGVVNFIVRDDGTAAAGPAEATDVVPVAWIDLDGDNGYETAGNNAPTEPFALGGVTNFAATVDEAVTESYSDEVVASVNVAGDSFVGTTYRFDYDANDIFLKENVRLVDLAAFEAILSATDEIDIVYYIEPAGTSTFNITTDNVAVGSLRVTDPARAISIDSANYTITGTGEPGAAIRIFADTNNDGYANEAVLATTTVAADESWSATVMLTQAPNGINNFVAWQRVGTADPTTADVPTITEGAEVAALLTTSDFTAVDPAGFSVDDGIVITFNEGVTGVGNGDSIAIIDEDGSTATIVFGNDTRAELSTAAVANDTLTLTILNAPFATGGTEPGITNGPVQITAINGFEGADGLTINLVGSGAGRVFTVV